MIGRRSNLHPGLLLEGMVVEVVMMVMVVVEMVIEMMMIMMMRRRRRRRMKIQKQLLRVKMGIS